MSRNWTVESAKAYVSKVVKGKQQTGLKYCSAVDFLINHGKNVDLHKEENNNDSSGVDI